MRLVLFHVAGASLPSPLTFLTLQAFCWADIVSVTNKVDAVTVVWGTTQELFQVLILQFMEGATPKSLLMLDESHGIYYHYSRLTRWR